MATAMETTDASHDEGFSGTSDAGLDSNVIRRQPSRRLSGPSTFPIPSFSSSTSSMANSPSTSKATNLLLNINDQIPQNTPLQNDGSHLNLPYRLFLHRAPHVKFTLVEPPPCACVACDAPDAAYRCTTCELVLCGRCQELMCSDIIRGNMHWLISAVARWKLGYSRAFLESQETYTRQLERGRMGRVAVNNWKAGEAYSYGELEEEEEEWKGERDWGGERDWSGVTMDMRRLSTGDVGEWDGFLELMEAEKHSVDMGMEVEMEMEN